MSEESTPYSVPENDPTMRELKAAYHSAPLPQPSAELRSAVEAELASFQPQPAKENAVQTGAKSSGVLVLTVSVLIAAVAVTLLWQWDASQQTLAELGEAVGNLDQSYSHSNASHEYGERMDTCDDDNSTDGASRCLVLGSDVSGNGEVPVQTSGNGARPNLRLDSTSNDVRWSINTPKPVSPELVMGPAHEYGVALDGERYAGEVRGGIVKFHDGAVDLFGRFERDGLADAGLGDVVDGFAIDLGGDFEGRSAERFARIYENNFKITSDHPLSTFSIDVDTASYSKVRQYLNAGQMPPPDSVRIEELVNYFPYEYLPPMGVEPFTAHMEVCECPWTPEHRLARIAIKGQVMEIEDRPHSNLVFLLDVSGSMNQPNKLPLVKKGLKMLVARLGEKDRVAIVTYAGSAGLVLDSTSCEEKAAIDKAIDDLQPGGSTAGAAGIKLAYEIAADNFIEKGINRVLLCTDGDFNVGVSDDAGLVRLAEEQAKENSVFLSILGFGMDNLNDSMLEQVSGKANGMYAFIDTENEARKVLVEQLSGTLVTIAKDVKIQVEFNPAKVKGYRLIGYENRMLAAEDFNDDTKDAGEIGAGHNVTALYEIVPADAKVEVEAADIDDLKYQRPAELTDAADSDELLTLKLRYKQPDGDKSTLISFPVDDDTQRFGEASDDFQFAAAVASFGMLLRGSKYAGDATYEAVHEIASSSLGDDEWGYRKEFVELVAKAKEMAP